MDFVQVKMGFLGDTVVTNLPTNAGDTRDTGDLQDPLRKEMAAQSSILAWKIPWTDEPGRLQSMAS